MILRQTGEDSPRSSRRGGVPLIGTAAAIGLSVFFVCALYTHVRASDYSRQFGLAIGFLLLAVATLVLGLAPTLGECLS